MRKIITILLITASTFLYSQSMDLNHKKIHIVDSTMGLGISPTSRLHVFGNGTASGLLNITNDKDATKDSSVVITSSGNVGIGTTSPNTNLEITTASSSATLRVTSPSTTYNEASLQLFIAGTGTNDRNWQISTSHNVRGDLSFITSNTIGGDPRIAGTTRMMIDNLGNVGIGTTNPTSRLHIFGNGTTSNLFKLYNNRGTYNDSSIIVKANGSLILGDSSHILQSIDSPLSEARVTIVGGVPLRLLNSFNMGYTSLKWSARTDKDTIADYAQIMGCVEKNTFGLHSGSLYFQTAKGGGLSTKMYIDSSGYVGIGTTTPKDYLDINGNITFPNNQYIFWNAYNKGGTIYQRDISAACVLMYQKTGNSDKLFNIDITGANDSGNDTPINGPIRVLSVRTNAEINIHEEIMWRDSLGDYKKGTTLSDNEAYSLPTNISWKGEIDVDSLGYTLFTAQIRCDANGTPYLEGVSWKRWSSKTYVEVGSTDGYLNITDGGSGMVITNTLGYTIKATLRFRTKQ